MRSERLIAEVMVKQSDVEMRRHGRVRIPRMKSESGVSTLLCAVVVTLLVFVWGASCFAQQTTGSILGTVTDSTGALIPGANISAVNTATGVTANTISNADGLYQFVTLPAGTYTISAEKAGFGTTTLTGITLQVYQKAEVNVTLRVSSQTQTVTIRATTPLVDTTDASLGTVVDERAIRDLPLNLRQVGALALIVPATVDTSGRSLTTAGGNGSGFNDNSYSGAGGTSGSNLLLIDGMISRSLNNGSFALNPPPDFVREFKIQNNIYDAAFGISAGTTMNLVTQSGTNQFHGGVWEYLRNRNLDAREWGQTYANLPEKPAYDRNQFGGDIGGPIVKDKLFAFLGYEAQRQTRAGGGLNAVPSTAQKQGEFSGLLSGTSHNLCGAGGPGNLVYDTGQIFDPRTVTSYICPNSGANILVGTPVPGNDVATYLGGAQNFDPVAQKVLPFFHDPTPGSIFYVNPASAKDDRNQYIGRIDWSAGPHDLVYGRYLLGTADQLYPGPFDPFNVVQHFRGHNAVGHWTHTFGPTLINDLLVGYQGDYLRESCQGCPRAPGTIESFGISNLAAAVPSFEEYPNFTFSNFPALGDGFPGFFPDVLPDKVYKYGDTVTKVFSHHNLTFGAELDFWNTDGVSDPVQANGLVAFSGQYSDLGAESSDATTGSDLADLEFGFPSYGQYTKGAFITRLVGGRWLSLFVQDNYHVLSNLTIEAGMRWELRKQPVDKNNQVAAFFPLSKSYTPGDALLISAYPDAQNDALCGQAYFTSADGQCLVATSGERRDLGFTGNKRRELSFGAGRGDFAPRLGISYQPLMNNRLVIHAGVGSFLNLPVTNMLGSYANNNPISTQTRVYAPTFGSPPPSNESGPITTQGIFEVATTPNLSQIAAQVLPSPYYHTPTIWEWSLSVQSQLLKNTALEVAYIGNHGYHEDFNHQDGNQAVPNTASTQEEFQQFRPWPDFGQITYDSYDAYSNYNALTVKLTQRVAHGLSGLVSYTYGKGLSNDDGTTDGGGNGAQNAPQNDNNPNAEYGLAKTSLRHRVVVSGVYQLPFGRGRDFLANSNAATNAIIGGWNISGIITAQSGFPFTVYSSNDFSNTGSPSARPDRTCKGDGPRKLDRWFDTDCFSTAALAAALANGTPRFGNSGRNILTGPRLVNVDTSLAKNIPIFDRVTTKFSASFFNMLNHPNYAAPDSTIGSFTVGQITGTVGDSREIQLSLRMDF